MSRAKARECELPGDLRRGPAAYTIKTGPDGSYQWWIPAADNQMVVIGVKDDYIQQVTMAGVGFARPGQPGRRHHRAEFRPGDVPHAATLTGFVKVRR